MCWRIDAAKIRNNIAVATVDGFFKGSSAPPARQRVRFETETARCLLRAASLVLCRHVCLSLHKEFAHFELVVAFITTFVKSCIVSAQ